MSTRILFVNPRYGGRDGLIILPLDQASCVSYAQAQGCDVDVLDLAFKSSDSQLESLIERTEYDLVVLTAITICFRTAVDAAQVIKRVRPDQPVAIMGEHVTYRRDETLLRHQCFDFVLSFEAEETSIELAEALRARKRGECVDLSKVRGISYRVEENPRRKLLPVQGRDRSANVMRTPDRRTLPDLDHLPIPAKRDYDIQTYLDRDRETTVVTTRGCTHRCRFCHRWRYGRKLRNWSLPRVYAEILDNLDIGFDSIFFQDDVFCYDKERTRALCQWMVDNNLGLRWNCNVRIDDFKPEVPEHHELAALMQRAGCYRIFVGIEAFDQELLDRSKKLAQVELIRSFVQFWQGHGVQVHASYIVGLPGDTEPMIDRRVELAVELCTDLASFNRIFPHPGTPYGDDPDRWGIVVPDPFWYEKTDWWTEAVAGNETLSCEDVYRLQQRALINYTESLFAVSA